MYILLSRLVRFFCRRQKLRFFCLHFLAGVFARVVDLRLVPRWPLVVWYGVDLSINPSCTIPFLLEMYSHLSFSYNVTLFTWMSGILFFSARVSRWAVSLLTIHFFFLFYACGTIKYSFKSCLTCVY